MASCHRRYQTLIHSNKQNTNKKQKQDERPTFQLLVFCFNSLTPKMSLAILLTVCHTVLVMLVWRIWDWINL